jgi:hypothetical protein
MPVEPVERGKGEEVAEPSMIPEVDDCCGNRIAFRNCIPQI